MHGWGEAQVVPAMLGESRCPDIEDIGFLRKMFYTGEGRHMIHPQSKLTLLDIPGTQSVMLFLLA